MRLLKALVFGMGALILVGIGVLGWGLAHRVAPGASSAGPGIDEPSYSSIEVPTPDAMAFQQMSATADRLLLRFSGAAGERIVVVDPKSGRVTGTIDVPPAGK